MSITTSSARGVAVFEGEGSKRAGGGLGGVGFDGFGHGLGLLLK
nr:hypothetical protein [uncultured Haemophilus sp.]